jgi:hypothetical protein
MEHGYMLYAVLEEVAVMAKKTKVYTRLWHDDFFLF